MSKVSKRRIALVALLTQIGWSAAFAQTPEEKGYAIAARADRSDRGFGDSAVELRMILRNRRGQESERALRLTTLEVMDESVGDKSLIVFDQPRDVKTCRLAPQTSHAKILDPDDQWLYLPSLKRIKRISSANKSGPFLGSEFAFEDFTSQELNKFGYRFLRSETCGALECDVLELKPKYQDSGYTSMEAWIDQTDHQYRKVDFYDRAGELLKTLELSDYRQYDGKYWRAHRQSMTNHKKGKSSEFLFSDYTFGVGLGDEDFVRDVLQRTR